MGKLLPRRIEWVALIVPVLLAAVHFWSIRQSPIGLDVGGERTPALARLILQLEGRATDFKFRLRGTRAPSPDVVVVEVDEKGAQKYGLWPWPRDLMAKGIERLIDAGAGAVGTDISWTDETHDFSQVYRELLAKLPEGDATAAVRAELQAKIASSPDEALEASLKRAGPQLVQGVLAFNEPELKDLSAEKAKKNTELLTGKVIEAAKASAHSTLKAEKVRAWSQYSVLAPLERFANAGNRLGHFAFVPDIDGTIRRTPLLMKLQQPPGFMPSLALQTAAAFRHATLEATASAGELSGAQLCSGEQCTGVPLEEGQPFMLVNHYGPGESYARLSLADVIDGTFDAAKVKGKAVLIGVTLSGNSGDQRVTPFRELEPGIYSHAAVLSNVLQGDYLTRPWSLVVIEPLLMFVLGVLLVVWVARSKRFTTKAAVMVAAGGAWVIAGQVLFQRGVELSMVMPLSSVLLTSFASVFAGYLSVDREKLKLRATFSKYLGEDVMEEALKNPDKLSQGEKREMTVMFSDIRGFTTLSERMLPEKLAVFINQYLSPMTAIVFEEKGTLDKYIGDAVMAFWNAPLDQADHALRACRAAIAMTKKLEELKAKWRSENYPEFDIGIGINTGPMIVGNMGSDVRVDYTIMGDSVNLGSRLEGTNKEYQTRIIMGEGTYERVKEAVFARRLGAVRVKGKRKPVKIYELRGIGLPQGSDAQATQAFEAGLDAYAEQRWADALARFEEVLNLWPEDGPSRRYLEEIPALQANPPGPGWDGVYTAPTK
ncbi:MAG: adenylate/guanylate cyclase domain-containing protein [Myxococcaceae bacterium]